jgi:uncharacterized protein YbcC (UPF0753/DUF2309 family)
MTATLQMLPGTVTPSELAPAIDAATARIAPSWPLDRMIAVNPYWGFVSQPMPEAAAALRALAGTRLVMSRSWFRAQLRSGRVSERHVAEALHLAGSGRAVNEVLAELERDSPEIPVRRLITDLADRERDLTHHMSWSDFVTRHLSQAAAACFDEGQARWTPERKGGLYGVWRELATHDLSPRLLMGLHDFREAVADLPEDPRDLIALGTTLLGVPAEAREAWYTALLMTVHGWASACAFRRWEARLTGGDDEQIVHLLAGRMAWEVILYRLVGGPAMAARWNEARADWNEPFGGGPLDDEPDWVLQRALELAYQEKLMASLSQPPQPPIPTPSAQAVFCIDVRSEVLRRRLEAASPTIQTLGFAGFFGLPIAYRSPAGQVRPQLPGLLPPTLVAEDATAAAVAAPWQRALERKAAWKDFATTPGSAFSFIEIAGLAHGVALLRDALGLGQVLDPLRGALGAEVSDALRPELTRHADGGAIPLENRVKLAAGVLRAMSLTRGFARLVAVIGHGAGVTNNPQAAGLHCGACGGQTGEVNARALAALLNDPAVRAGLHAEGISLPATTWVVPGLHNTTTDDVTLYDLDRVPTSHRCDVADFQRQLADAGRTARAERAASLGLGGVQGDDLDRAIRRRATDWSEVRPEWGLAKNAAFVVAPRERTRAINLEGRSFLHEYRWQDDTGYGVLELIMTAPMVVTHWINMQYYASTVDPHRYGSGNKVLHNVVGGRLGVFEGAGGDLRFGLSLQSVHDGREWYHEPLRLSVVIEAPAEAMDGIIAKHPVVRQLVENEWIFLYRVDSNGRVQQRRADGWHPRELSLA